VYFCIGNEAKTHVANYDVSAMKDVKKEGGEKQQQKKFTKNIHIK
jgi:hypothetical protein